MIDVVEEGSGCFFVLLFYIFPSIWLYFETQESYEGLQVTEILRLNKMRCLRFYGRTLLCLSFVHILHAKNYSVKTKHINIQSVLQTWVFSGLTFGRFLVIKVSLQ